MKSAVVRIAVVLSLTFLLVAALAPRGGAASTGREAVANEPGFVALFDGKTLDGWEVMGPNRNAFRVEDGAIFCDGKDGFWLRCTRKEYGNFVLRLDYKVSKGANSGVFLRCLKDGDPPYTGSEIQILDDHGRDPNKNSSGAVYDVVTPMFNMSKPAGEWNSFEITCDDGHVVVLHNGRKVIDCDYNELTTPIGKFSTPYAQLPKVGWIGLQDHGTYVWFRNLRIRELPPTPKAAPKK